MVTKDKLKPKKVKKITKKKTLVKRKIKKGGDLSSLYNTAKTTFNTQIQPQINTVSSKLQRDPSILELQRQAKKFVHTNIPVVYHQYVPEPLRPKYNITRSLPLANVKQFNPQASTFFQPIISPTVSFPIVSTPTQLPKMLNISQSPPILTKSPQITNLMNTIKNEILLYRLYNSPKLIVGDCQDYKNFTNFVLQDCAKFSKDPNFIQRCKTNRYAKYNINEAVLLAAANNMRCK